MSPILSTAVTALTLLSAFASAAPATSCKVSQPMDLANIKVPLTNGSATLPGSGSFTLKALAIGVGFQNYTCASKSASVAPVNFGAVATMTDATSILPFVPPVDDESVLEAAPAYFQSLGRAKIDRSRIPKLGEHHFNAAGEAVFDLTRSKNGLFVGSKVADIAAPAAGQHGQFGNVDWLALDAKAGSDGLSLVYRTVTAGGKPPKTCEDSPAMFREPYAAQYYFFG